MGQQPRHTPASYCWSSSSALLAESRPSFYSHVNAPGVIMAAGNTGEFLDSSADNTCTWLSRDGGLNWEDVADYAAIYEFGDHGSIILTARYQVILTPKSTVAECNCSHRNPSP